MAVHIRKVIDGEVYDTDTASLAHVCVNAQLGWDDFNTEWTGLYRSLRSQWFLAGEGGACTRWRRQASDRNGYVCGEGLTLVTADEARELLEAHDGDVEMYFEVEEG